MTTCLALYLKPPSNSEFAHGLVHAQRQRRMFPYLLTISVNLSTIWEKRQQLWDSSHWQRKCLQTNHFKWSWNNVKGASSSRKVHTWLHVSYTTVTGSASVTHQQVNLSGVGRFIQQGCAELDSSLCTPSAWGVVSTPVSALGQQEALRESIPAYTYPQADFWVLCECQNI